MSKDDPLVKDFYDLLADGWRPELLLFSNDSTENLQGYWRFRGDLAIPSSEYKNFLIYMMKNLLQQLESSEVAQS